MERKLDVGKDNGSSSSSSSSNNNTCTGEQTMRCVVKESQKHSVEGEHSSWGEWGGEGRVTGA